MKSRAHATTGGWPSGRPRLAGPYLAPGLCLALVVAVVNVPVEARQGGPEVVVDRAETVDLIEEVPLTGTVVSPRIARLSTEVSGIVEAMKVEIGDMVDAGDEILMLNAELESLRLEAVRAETEQAAQELEDSRRRLVVARSLAKERALPANELDSLATEVRIDSAGLNRFQAVQQRLAAQLDRHTLRAPFAGVISRKLVEQGEWIQPGQPVVELVASTGLRLDFQAPQSVYPKLDDSARLSLQLDAWPGRTFDGTIETVIPVADPATRTFLIRAALDDAQVKIAPGMSASAVLRLNRGTRGVAVHRDALIRHPDGRTTVWVVAQDGDAARVAERRVETGLSFDVRVAITSGLSAGTPVVVQGNEALREGQNVTVRRAE